jgi:hypothetical protein
VSRCGGDDNGFFHTLAQRPLCPPPVPRSEMSAYDEAEIARQFAEAGAPLPWPDVHLPHRWDLNQARVSDPAIPTRGTYLSSGDPTAAVLDPDRYMNVTHVRSRHRYVARVWAG